MSRIRFGTAPLWKGSSSGANTEDATMEEPTPPPPDVNMEEPASFEQVAGTTYVLMFNGVKYEMYKLVDHGVDQAPIKYSSARTFTGVADSFPPLEGDGAGLLAYRTYDCSLYQYLLNNRIPSGTKGRISDRVKAIMSDLGFIIIHCFRNGMKLDIDPELKNVYICNDGDGGYPRVKVVVIPGAEDLNWKETLTNAMKKIKSVLDESMTFGVLEKPVYSKITDAEFDDFTAALENIGSIPGSVERCFRSTFFWNKSQRVALINKLGELVDNLPNGFFLCFNTPSLLGWRDTMENDNLVGTSVVNDAERNGVPIANENRHRAKEVECLLKFVRGNLSHFVTMTGGLFSSAGAWLDYYEESFPVIMSDIYKGAVKLEERNLHKFYLGHC